MLECQADFVETVEQAVLAVRRDVETELETGRGCYRLRLQVNIQTIPFRCRTFLEQAVDHLG